MTFPQMQVLSLDNQTPYQVHEMHQQYLSAKKHQKNYAVVDEIQQAQYSYLTQQLHQNLKNRQKLPYLPLFLSFFSLRFSKLKVS